jgi:hypothetical protein
MAELDMLGFNYGKNTSFIDLFDRLSDSIKSSVKVGSLARYKRTTRQFDGYGIAEVTPFPLETGEQSYTIYAYFLNNHTFKDNELVEVLFNDSDFRSAISADKPQVTVSTKDLHSLMYGIIIPVTDTGGSTVVVDDAISATSTNPVQNKVIYAALQNKQRILAAGEGITITPNQDDTKDVIANVVKLGAGTAIEW